MPSFGTATKAIKVIIHFYSFSVSSVLIRFTTLPQSLTSQLGGFLGSRQFTTRTKNAQKCSSTAKAKGFDSFLLSFMFVIIDDNVDFNWKKSSYFLFCTVMKILFYGRSSFNE
jgi:hypothetical protein